jgi:hypothetical protein
MGKLSIPSFVVALGLAAPLFVASPAQAGIDACGNINVEASAECKAEVTGGCDVKCSPLTVRAACEGSCEGSCDLPSVECSGSCEAECGGSCETNPDFSCSAECSGSCEADCDGSCEGKCESSDNQTDCKAACKADCSAVCQGECKASCDGAPVTCEGQCKAHCEGSCKAKTNMSCELSCRTSCYAEMSGGCKAQCESPEGALYCDGQYVDDGGNAKACMDALAAIGAHVEGYADASAECSGGSCEAEAEAGCSLASISPKKPSGSAPYVVGLIGALGALVFGLRRRSK